jgi:hypothetical protein
MGQRATVSSHGGLALLDKSTHLILEALGRAAADPAGLPLHGGKTAPGLFAATATGKQAAQRCKDEGLLCVVHTEARGKTTREVCAITEKGLAYLLGQVSPKQVLEEFVHALKSRQWQADQLLDIARQMQVSLDALKTAAEKVLQQVHKPGATASPNGNGADTWIVAILSFLARRQESGATDDCTLAELYRQAQQAAPRLSIGQFHDGLRRLHAQEQIYLHPWSGPLYDLPEPPTALLVGHEIAYYASIRG